MRICFGAEEVELIVTPEQFSALRTIGNLQMAGMLSDDEFCERAKAICPDLKSFTQYRLVVKEWQDTPATKI